jgi:tetratricopeptide (TPR) repeat protein
MSLELNLYFPDPQHVTVSLIDGNQREETELFDFSSPLSDKGHQHLTWYLEQYPTQYSGHVDFNSAQQVETQFPVLGNALFNQVFCKRAQNRLLKKFQNHEQHGRVLTITANHLGILSLPWELLHETGKGHQFLMHKAPGISVRRRLLAPRQPAFQIQAKKQLHVLFIISRPTETKFTDPRAIALPLLNALDKESSKRITVEFLRPATLKQLHERLNHKNLPHIDILHFYGPFIFDTEGRLEQQANADLKALPPILQTEATGISTGKNTAYLVFEKNNGKNHLVPALLLSNLLHRYQVPLVILANANRTLSNKQDIHSVAAMMTATGVPFVLAIDILVKSATQQLFETFYQCLAQGQKIGTSLDLARLALYRNTERRKMPHWEGPQQLHLHDWFLPILYQQGQDSPLLTQSLPNEETEATTLPDKVTISNLPALPDTGFFGRHQELWDIERRFLRGTRRINLNGIEGQGKTCLAQESGRWLQRTGLFKRVVYIDYANFQGLNPVNVAVSMIAKVSQKNLLDVEAATQALRRVPTLLIFDNLEVLAKQTPASQTKEPDTHQGRHEGEITNTISLVNGVNQKASPVNYQGNHQSQAKTQTFKIDDDDDDDDKTREFVLFQEEENLAKHESSDFSSPTPLNPPGDFQGQQQTHDQLTAFQPLSETAEKTAQTTSFALQADGQEQRHHTGSSISLIEETHQNPGDNFSQFKPLASDENKPQAEAEPQPAKPELPQSQKANNNSPLNQLLDIAKTWSETGQSCVILITRQPKLDHIDFPVTGSLKYYQLPVKGLDEQAAICYFDALMTLPPSPAYGIPKREAVDNLIKQLNAHPLSISILACQLKKDSVVAVNERLAQLLPKLHQIPEAEKPLIASLYLSLEKLDGPTQQWLPRLGVFQGGAFENILQAITEIPNAQWQTLRQSLENTCLIRREQMDGVTVPYLKFHPSLAPMLWQQLPASEKQALSQRYRQGYYELASFLYQKDNDNPAQARTIELLELPNLLEVVKEAVDTGEEWLGDLLDKMESFLGDFGLKFELDKEALKEAIPEQFKDGKASEAFQEWYQARSKEGEKLYANQQYADSQAVFEDILDKMDDNKPSYLRCTTLGWIGRCLQKQEQNEAAVDYYRQKLVELGQLEPSLKIQREMTHVQTELADILTKLGEYSEAEEAYNQALDLVTRIGDARSKAVILGQLGTLEKKQGHYKEAEQYYQRALNLFEQLKIPKYEAIAWYQLGRIHEEAKQWDVAVRAYLKAARLQEQLGHVKEVNDSWYRLAYISQQIGNLQDAQEFYSNAIEAAKAIQDWKTVSFRYRKLAELLLQYRPERISEVRQLAEQALAIDQKLPPEETQIWETYTLLAKIADQQNAVIEAQNYRRLAREVQIKTNGLHDKLPRHQQFIDAVIQTAGKPKLRQQLDTMLSQREQKGWSKLVAATRRVLNGERDWETLCRSEDLDLEDALILQQILQQLNNYDTVPPSAPPQGQSILTGAPQEPSIVTGAPQGQNVVTGTPQGQNVVTSTPQGQGNSILTNQPFEQPQPPAETGQTTFKL